MWFSHWPGSLRAWQQSFNECSFSLLLPFERNLKCIATASLLMRILWPGWWGGMGGGGEQKASILGWRVPTNPLTSPWFASCTYFAFWLFVCFPALFSILGHQQKLCLLLQSCPRNYLEICITTKILGILNGNFRYHKYTSAVEMSRNMHGIQNILCLTNVSVVIQLLFQISQIYLSCNVKLSRNMHGIQNILCIWKCLTNISVVIQWLF